MFGVTVLAGLALAWSPLVIAPQLPWAGDFRIESWQAGRTLLDGSNPLRHGVEGTVYPAAATVATLPLAALPYDVAVVVWTGLLLSSVAVALWICGVRDWRCLALAYASPPVLGGLAYANNSLLLVLAVAAIWRWRDRPASVGGVLGLAIAGKLFLWPLVLWLVSLAGGRRRPRRWLWPSARVSSRGRSSVPVSSTTSSR